MSQYSFYQIWILHAIKSYGSIPLNRLYRILTGNRTMSTLIGVTEDKAEVFFCKFASFERSGVPSIIKSID